MNVAIGELLPLAVAIAISPLPIIAAILMLLSPRAKANSLSFLLGWTVGILAGVVVFLLVSALIPESDSGPSPVVGVIKIALGALLLFVGLRQWSKRPREGVTPEMPKWMTAINSMTAVKSGGLGFVLAVVNPKNLMMEISAGVTLGAADLSVGENVGVIAIFLVIAIITIAVPVIGALIAGTRMAPLLNAMREWLVANNSVVMTVLLVVIGTVNIGKGLGSF
jgi:hypothetical protein